MILLGLVASVVIASAPPRTQAESSDFNATSTHAQVVEFCDALAASTPRVSRLSLGKSAEGRELPLLLLADPPLRSKDEVLERLKQNDTLLVLAIGNIHGGEVDGKEGLMMLARDLAIDGSPLLRNLVLAVVPIYNADGNERFAKDNRPGQNGPRDGQGQRETASGLDLNRDFMKLDAPETRALMSFVREWDPHVFIDTHTTDGSFHRYIMTYCGPKAPAGDPAVIEFTRDSFFPAVSAAFARENDARRWDSFFYGNFEDEFSPGAAPENPRPHTRWETFPAEGRFGTTSFGLRSRISILTESYTYATFRERVEAQQSFVRCCLTELAARAGQIRAILAQADDRTISAHGDDVAIRTTMMAAPREVTIKGYVERIEKGRSVPTGEAAEYTVKHFDRFTAAASVKRPKGYVLAAQCPAEVIERLKLHGVVMEQLVQAREMNVAEYVIDKATPASREFQKRVLVHIEAHTKPPQTRPLEAGLWYVPCSQRLGNLVVYLLEPGCEDGLAAWGFMDRFLKPGESYPILRIEP